MAPPSYLMTINFEEKLFFAATVITNCFFFSMLLFAVICKMKTRKVLLDGRLL